MPMKSPAQRFLSCFEPARILLFILLLLGGGSVSAQEPPPAPATDTTQLYQVVKNDGAVFMGRIISQNEREVVIETRDRGRVLIPMHEVRVIRAVNTKPEQAPRGHSGDSFPSHYLLTTGAFPLKKEQGYMVFSWYGVDYHVGLTDRLGIGLTSTWVGMPMAGTVKYSIPLSSNVSFGIGGIIGSGTWLFPEIVVGVPYAGITMGSGKLNMNLSYGYACIFESGEATKYRPAYSIAAAARLSKSFSLIFDSMVLPSTDSGTDWQGMPTTNALTAFSPSFRWSLKSGNAFQAGIVGIRNGDNTGFAFPTIQYIRWIE